MSRWAKPAKVLDVQHAPDETITFPDGRTYADVAIALPEADVERVRQGRLCILCLEPQEEAFPENCGVCGFGIRGQQAEVFRRRYKGEVKLGSSIDLEAERERLGELDAYEQRTGIKLPDHVKFPSGRIE
jgi:hypothetical protein